MKIRPVGAELFHAEVQTDGQVDRRDEVNSTLHNFATSPKNDPIYFMFIFPCIVIFYGITNRCDNVQ